MAGMEDRLKKSSELVEELLASEFEDVHYTRHLFWWRDFSSFLLIACIALWGCIVAFVVVLGLPELRQGALNRPLFLTVSISSGLWLTGLVGGFLVTMNKALAMRREARWLSKKALVALLEYLDEEDGDEPVELFYERNQLNR